MKHLFVMRHAKSDWNSSAPSDFERPLATRGIRDAPRIAHWLREQPRQPEVIVASPAVRAHQTAGHICEGLGRRVADLVLEPQIYGADVTDLLGVIAVLPPEIDVAMLIGHNPGVEELVVYLVGAVALSEYNKVMPTAAIYHLELGETWGGLEAGCAKVITAMRPKALHKSFKAAKPRD